MAAKKPKKAKPADPKPDLQARIDKSKAVLAKHKDKPINDPKRRLAHKKLKRVQRALGKIVKLEKRAAAAKAAAAPAAS